MVSPSGVCGHRGMTFGRGIITRGEAPWSFLAAQL